VEEHALGARERHGSRRPALELAGLQRLDQRLGIAAFRLIESLGDDHHVAEAVERGIDRRFLVFLLVRLREPGADVGELLLRRVIGDEIQLVAGIGVQLPELRPDRRVVGDEHRRLRRESQRGRLLQHQVHRLAHADVDDEVGLERLGLEQQRREIRGRMVEADRLQLDAELLLLGLLLRLRG
jgi:hypothetical protein